jgi:hypothetical protein
MVLTFVIATYADKVFSDRSNNSFDVASQLRNALLPRLASSKASVMSFSPVELSVQSCLTSELLRFL